MTNRTCTYPDCDEPYCAKGYCMGHYKQMSRYGHPTGVLSKKRSRFKILFCAFPGCGRWCYGRLKLCKAHYAQKRKGQKLHQVRPYNC